MKNYLLLGILAAFLFSCNGSSSSKSELGKEVGNPENILSSFNSWWSYHSKYVKLYERFVAFDAASNVIEKAAFMDSLSTGKFVAIKYITQDSLPQYKLYPVNASTDPSIGLNAKNVYGMDNRNFQMEGKPLPAFDFISLEGDSINATNTKGKVVVMKYWFIGCLPCVQEMPALNKLYDQYADRKDIQFVSLALDTEDKLRQFLKKTEFHYPTVGNQKDYLTKDLNIRVYPTHLIINKAGLVSGVVNNSDALMEIFEREVR